MKTPNHSASPGNFVPRTRMPLCSTLVTNALFISALLLGLIGVSGTANAACWFVDASGNAIDAPPTQIVTISPITIALPNNPTPGNNIGNPVAATVSGGTIYIECDYNGGTPGGLQPSYGTYNATNNTIYSPTPGVAFQILRSGTAIPLYPNGSLNAFTTYTFSNTTTFQLVSTGVLPSNGNQIPAGTVLGQWQFNNLCVKNPVISFFALQSCGATDAVHTIMIFQSGGVTFTASTCSVSSGSQNLMVPLPDITASTLGSVGPKGTAKQFTVNLTGCKKNKNLSVSAELDTSNVFTGASGVIAPAGAGYATGVGIQILKPDGVTPVTFGASNAFAVGTTNGNTSFSFSLFARYYVTSTPVTAGPVQGVATYTLIYQ